MRIAVLGHDLSSNAYGRAYIIARLCQSFADVTVWGTMLKGEEWPPLAGAFPRRIHPLALGPRPRFGTDARQAAGQLSEASDLIYACKPLATSYGVARLARQRHGTPLVLDNDDWELGFLLTGGVPWKIFADGVRHWRDPLSYFPTKRLDRLAQAEPFQSVSNSFLQRRFGGVVVPHVRDAKSWDSARFRVGEMKKRHGLDGKKVVLFHGTPRPHKGVSELVEAVAGIPESDVVLVLAGASPSDPFVQSLQEQGKGRVHVIGHVPFDEIPGVVAMADVCVVPQRREIGTQGQVPAKIIDAMMMAKPLVATRVGPIPEVVDKDSALLVEPGSVQGLREAIQQVLADPGAAHRMGLAARQRALREYSHEAVVGRVRTLVESAVNSAA